MSKVKYSTLTLILEERIRQGFYTRRLPNTLELLSEFSTSRKTVTKALRPLVESGLLISGGKRGMLINKQDTGSRGVIAVISNFDPNNPENDISHLLHKECRLIQQSGFEPFCVTLPQSAQFGNPERFLRFAEDVSGLLFTNSTLTLEMALYLEKLNKPFLSCNQLPVYRRLNYVESDNFASIREVAAYLRRLQYRKIAFFFPSELESYQRQTRKKWQMLSRELDITDLPCNHFACDFSQDIRCQISSFLHQVRNGEKPDITLLWSGYLGENAEDYRLLADFCGGGYKLAGTALSPLGNENKPENLYRIYLDHWQDVFQAAVNALLELIIARPGKPIQRLQPMYVEYTDPIPPCC